MWTKKTRKIFYNICWAYKVQPGRCQTPQMKLLFASRLARAEALSFARNSLDNIDADDDVHVVGFELASSLEFF